MIFEMKTVKLFANSLQQKYVGLYAVVYRDHGFPY